MTAAEPTVIDRRDAICVVGAGSSGITAAKNLRERGFAVVVYEREDDLGGNWHFGQPGSRVYRSTHMISSKPFTEYPDFPMPDDFPDYPHHSDVLAYLRRYVGHFGIGEAITHSTSVERIDSDDDGRTWTVTVEGPDGTRTTSRFGGVVIANGHNWYPKRPEYPGTFTGEIMHSADYKDPSVLRGKRVLVVGAGNTGCDIAVEAAQNAEATFHSTRRGYWYAQKYYFGRPGDQINDLFHGLRLPTRLHQRLQEATLRLTHGDLTRFGMKAPDHRMLETHPIVNQQLVYYVGHGEITPVEDIAELDGDTVRFTDGRREVVDLIVSCTGYLVRFPFIDHGHLGWEGDRPRLHKHVFPPRSDTLFVCGLIQPDSGQFKLVHWQSVAIAAFLEAQRERPAAAERLRQRRTQVEEKTLSGGVRYAASTRHYFEVNHYRYLEGLADLVHDLTGDPGIPVMEPLRWAFPPKPVRRNVVTQLPGTADERPPLLFVHGACHGAWCWQEQWMPAAAGQGWACFAVDLRGHGDSDGHDDIRRWTLRDYEHDVLQTIAELPSPPVLIGHSMGALIVRRVLARYAAPAAVLVAPPGGRHGLGAVPSLLRRQPGQVARAAALQPVRFGADVLVSELRGEAARRYEALLTDESALALLEVVAAPRPSTARTPVLVLGGGADRLVPVPDLVAAAKVYRTRPHVYRGLGHSLMVEPSGDAPLRRMLGWLEALTA